MTGLQFAEFVTDYVMPVGLIIMFVQMIYLFTTEALVSYHRLKREREQRGH